MPGRITALAVQPGEAVARGQPLVSLEAMKMEHALVAPFDGEVEAVSAAVGDQVSEGVALVKLRAAT
jgi:biotin carboxyl carrier protein